MTQGKYGPRMKTGLTESLQGKDILSVVMEGEIFFSGLGWEN